MARKSMDEFCVAAVEKGKLGAWRRSQKPWGEFLSCGSLSGVVHGVGCLGYFGMCSSPDTLGRRY